MIRTYVELPGWSLEIDEKSAGVYQVVAKDTKGHAVSKIGIDPELLIDECKREAIALQKSGTRATGTPGTDHD